MRVQNEIQETTELLLIWSKSERGKTIISYKTCMIINCCRIMPSLKNASRRRLYQSLLHIDYAADL